MLRIVAATLMAIFVEAEMASAAEPPTLTIYTYESFVSEWGPGPAIQPLFEASCACKIEWVGLEDGAALLSRLKLEGKDTKADIVLGLDNNLTAEAARTGLFADLDLDLSGLSLPVEWTDRAFVPFDYGYFAFVYDSEALPNPPRSLSELTQTGDQPKFITMDPRTSTPGLGLLLWVKAVYGDKARDVWPSLVRRTLTVTKGWSEGYGLFLKGEAPMVLSYTTSPAYHEMMEQTERYKAAIFAEGHYMQVEVAGKIASTAHADLADQFLQFLLSRQAQEKIPTTNWMFPVIDLGDGLPREFHDLPAPPKTLTIPDQEVADHREEWINEWLQAAAP